MNVDAVIQANAETREVWNQNAAFWKERMGDGNDFVDVLIWPATKRLLALRPGERVLDIACGTGLSSRRLAAGGVEVVAFDFAEEMIGFARQWTTPYSDRIKYYVRDATDEAALLGLGQGKFDAALCHMALFDMAAIEPLLRALAQMLRPGGRFVFSVLHPCFNNPYMALMAELRDRDGELVTDYAVKVFKYMTPSVARGAAMQDQPKAQLIFHRHCRYCLAHVFEPGSSWMVSRNAPSRLNIPLTSIHFPGAPTLVKFHPCS